MKTKENKKINISIKLEIDKSEMGINADKDSRFFLDWYKNYLGQMKGVSVTEVKES